MSWLKNTVFPAVIFLVLIRFTWSSSEAFNNKEVVKRARCYANCITIVRSNASSPDRDCHGDSCSQCSRACHMISRSLVNCTASCANSSWCKKSCQYIETTIKKWKNIYTGDGTSIPKPTAPIAAVRTVASLTLSWQPVDSTIGGSVVYLLKEKFEQKSNKGIDELSTVFTKNKAIISVQNICYNVKANWYEELKFYFTVVALTENSSLLLGDMSRAIEMAKPNHVSKVNIPQFSYIPSPEPHGSLIFRTSFVPSTSPHTKLITKYGLMLLTTTSCQKFALSPKLQEIDKGKTDVEMSLFYKLFAGCNHTIKVYSLVHCVASSPKTLVYKYPGCFNIPSFDRKTCYSFDTPVTPKSSRRVRNLNHSQIQTGADFRFRVNVTWNRPWYPYYNTTTYEVFYGDESKTHSFHGSQRFWAPDYINSAYKGTRIEMKNLLPNTKYKYVVTPFIPLVRRIEGSGSFRTPELPKDELKVQNVVPRSLGFSRTHFFSFNVSWEKPRFGYGNLVGFTIFTMDGNTTTKNNFHLVRGIRYSEPFKMQVKPNYAQKWIIGSVKDIQLKGKEPNRTALTVQSLKEHHQKDDENDWYRFVMSWKAPTFQHKTVDYYQVAYSLTGYPYHAMECKPGKVTKPTCGPTKTRNTTYEIVQVLPSEHIVFTVTPIFANSTYVKGFENTLNVDAPYPRRDLVAVRNLTYIGTSNTNVTKCMVFSWESPLFKHSNASRYMVKFTITAMGDNMANPTVKRRTMRSVYNQTRSSVITKIVSTTAFLAPPLAYNKQVTVEVTPVFDVEIIVGERSTITVTNPSDPSNPSPSINPIAIAGIALGSFVVLLLVVVLLLWLIKRQKQIKDGVLVGRKGAVFDQWEVPVEKIYLEEDLGEGAFGKVFKAVLLELPEQSAKYSIAKSIRRKSLMPMNQEDGFVVAVKMLHDMADEDQRREFLKEIQLMKEVGSHRNIVNMLGCGTLSDPMFLIVEYLPNGDLLHYLRKRRGKATKYPDSDPRGPYHSTYCQTYFNKYKPEEGISVQATRRDRIYVHSPENNKEPNKDGIELLSVQKVEADNKEPGSASNGAMESDKFGVDDETLTSGDLMAFAWQVSQGMEYLSKRGYVHRDLAARNVLVGNNKEAKIADFGLTRQMYEDLYQAKSNRRLPLKWMSVEAIFDQSFTSQSDVWAYGVFLWELVTLGGTPYPSINNRELLKLLKEGYRMEKPDTCDNELYEIMCSCWKELPEDRPTFEDLRSKLEDMMTRDNPYFDPSAVDESRDYYNVPSFNSAPDPDEDDDIIEDIFGEGTSSKGDEYKIKFISKNNEKRKNSRDNCAVDNDVSHSGDPWVLELDNDGSVNGHDLMGLDLDVSERAQNDSPIVEPKTKRKNIKYASLDFNDIEFQIYRHHNKGFEL